MLCLFHSGSNCLMRTPSIVLSHHCERIYFAVIVAVSMSCRSVMAVMGEHPQSSLYAPTQSSTQILFMRNNGCRHLWCEWCMAMTKIPFIIKKKKFGLIQDFHWGNKSYLCARPSCVFLLILLQHCYCCRSFPTFETMNVRCKIHSIVSAAYHHHSALGNSCIKFDITRTNINSLAAAVSTVSFVDMTYKTPWGGRRFQANREPCPNVLLRNELNCFSRRKFCIIKYQYIWTGEAKIVNSWFIHWMRWPCGQPILFIYVRLSFMATMISFEHLPPPHTFFFSALCCRRCIFSVHGWVLVWLHSFYSLQLPCRDRIQ